MNFQSFTQLKEYLREQVKKEMVESKDSLYRGILTPEDRRFDNEYQ